MEKMNAVGLELPDGNACKNVAGKWESGKPGERQPAPVLLHHDIVFAKHPPAENTGTRCRHARATMCPALLSCKKSDNGKQPGAVKRENFRNITLTESHPLNQYVTA